MSVGEMKFSEASAEDQEAFVDSFISPAEDDPTKETPAGDDDSAGESAAEGGEGEGDTEEDIFGTELREHAAAIGLTDEQLSEFSSREELDRAMRLLDARAMQMGRDAAKDDGKDGDKEKQATPETRARDDQGRFAKPDAETSYSVKLDPEIFPEEVIEEFNALRDHYESRIDSFEQRFAVLEETERLRQEVSEQREFDSILDSLDHPELFGTTGKETRAERTNRENLWKDLQAYIIGLKGFGREVRADREFVARVMNMTFAEHLSQKTKNQLITKAKSQSQRRSGSAGTKHVDKTFNGPLRDDPEVLAEFERLTGVE